MCLVVLALGEDPDFPFILVNNRDENIYRAQSYELGTHNIQIEGSDESATILCGELGFCLEFT